MNKSKTKTSNLFEIGIVSKNSFIEGVTGDILLHNIKAQGHIDFVLNNIDWFLEKGLNGTLYGQLAEIKEYLIYISDSCKTLIEIEKASQ